MLRRFALPLALLLIAAHQAHSQSIIHVIDKAADYSQTDVGTTAFNSDIGYSFISEVIETSGSTLHSGNPSTAPSFDNGSVTSLAWNASRNRWYFESSGHTSQGALDTAYANGSYTFNFDGNSAAVSLTGDLYPDVASATMSAGSWSGGEFYVNASEAFSITTNTWTTNYLDGQSRIQISIDGSSFNQQTDNNNSGSSHSMNLNSFDLTSGQSYEVTLIFDRFVSSADLGSTGSDNTYASYSNITTFTLNAVPEPSTWAVFAGLAALGFVIYRRRVSLTASAN